MWDVGGGVSGFMVSGFRFQSFRSRVSGFGFRVSGFGFRVSGLQGFGFDGVLFRVSVLRI